MQYSSLLLYKPVNEIIFPNTSSSGKSIALSILSENSTFLQVVKSLNIPFGKIKLAFIPSYKKPLRFYLSSDYMKNILSLGLKPARGYFEDIENLSGKNFYIDLNSPFDFFINKLRIGNFNTPFSLRISDLLLSGYENLDPNTEESTLIYSVNVDDPSMEKAVDNNTIKTRKIFPIFRSIYLGENIPFDKIILHASSKLGSKYVLIYDKMNKLNIERFKYFIKNPNLHKIKEEISEEQIQEQVILNIVKKIIGK